MHKLLAVVLLEGMLFGCGSPTVEESAAGLVYDSLGQFRNDVEDDVVDAFRRANDRLDGLERDALLDNANDVCPRASV